MLGNLYDDPEELTTAAFQLAHKMVPYYQRAGLSALMGPHVLYALPRDGPTFPSEH